MKELQILKPNVTCTVGKIEFKDYENLKRQVSELADHIERITVTEDNIKNSKKLLAEVNKAVRELNDERILIKKKINEPYEDFNNQIKEIESIVKSADEKVRQQVRDLEEKEREEKKKELENIWNKRIVAYDFAKLMKFEDWISNWHLNKTTSINKAEQDLVDFLEKTEQEVETLSNMEHSDELIAEYKEIKNIGIAIGNVQDRHKKIEKHKEVLSEVINDKEYCFIIKGEKDAKLVELLLKENNIEFIRR